MKISDIHNDCKTIADKHGLTVQQISVSFKQHYVDYIGEESPLYIDVTCYYLPIDDKDYGNFSATIGPDSDKDFNYNIFLQVFETECIRVLQKKSDELLNVETDSMTCQ